MWTRRTERGYRKGGDLRFRIKWLILTRLMVVTLLLGLSFFLHPNHFRNSGYLVSSIYLLTVVYTVLLPRLHTLSPFIAAQLTVDLILVSFLIGLTGGIESPFAFLYLIVIFGWAVFYQRLGAVLATVFSALFYGLAIVVPYWGLFRSFPPVWLIPGEFSYTFLIHLLGFFTVGLLSGRLSETLKEHEIGYAALSVLHEDIVKSISSGLLTTDREGRIVSFNRAATEILGYNQEEALGSVWWDLLAWGEILERYQRLFSEGVPQRFEGKTRNRWGERLHLGVTISPLQDGRGRQVGVIGIFQDLTQYVRMEEEMARRERLATIGEMAAGIAHEIRNPLAALSGSIQALSHEVGEISNENGRLLEIALQEADRLNGIVTQFLHYARPLPLRLSRCGMAALIEDTLTMARNSPDYRETVEIRFTADAGLACWIDPDQMKQVFWNLIANAFQSMPDGGRLTVSLIRVERQVRSKDDRKGDAVEIRFSDTGEGIPADQLDKIFNPFYTTKSQGSGLGLAIVHRIVEGHGGRVDVRSLERGTAFSIFLPAEPSGQWITTAKADGASSGSAAVSGPERPTHFVSSTDWRNRVWTEAAWA